MVMQAPSTEIDPPGIKSLDGSEVAIQKSVVSPGTTFSTVPISLTSPVNTGLSLYLSWWRTSWQRRGRKQCAQHQVVAATLRAEVAEPQSARNGRDGEPPNPRNPVGSDQLRGDEQHQLIRQARPKERGIHLGSSLHEEMSQPLLP